MKSIKVLAFAGLVLLALGFVDLNNYEEHTYTVRLKAGETVEGVSERFYELNQNGDSYDAFRHNVMSKNRVLFVEGRSPQVNDLVIIPVMVRR